MLEDPPAQPLKNLVVVQIRNRFGTPTASNVACHRAPRGIDGEQLYAKGRQGLGNGVDYVLQQSSQALAGDLRGGDPVQGPGS